MKFQIDDVTDFLHAIQESLRYTLSRLDDLEAQCNGVSDPDKLLDRILREVSEVSSNAEYFDTEGQKLKELPGSFLESVQQRIHERKLKEHRS